MPKIRYTRSPKGEILKLVFTEGVRATIADNSKFAQFVYQSMLKFNRGDWGAVLEEKWQANDEALESLVNGWYGRVHAAYNPPDTLRHWDATIWIIRNRVVQSVRENSRLLLNIADEDGLQFMTVLFPNEYS